MNNKIKISGRTIEIPIEKNRSWVCYYINSNGDERQKNFNNIEDGLAFTQLLDKRIDRGTCGGYSFMEI